MIKTAVCLIFKNKQITYYRKKGNVENSIGHAKTMLLYVKV